MNVHRISAIAAFILFFTSFASFAQWPEGEVELVQENGSEVTLRSIYSAKKTGDAVEDATVAAFNVLLTRGVSGLHKGQPIIHGDAKSFLYRLFNEKIYLRYLSGKPVKESETKIQGIKQVAVKLTIRAEGLVKLAQGGGAVINPAWTAGGKGGEPKTNLNPKVAVIPYSKGGGDDGFAALKEIIDNKPEVAYAVDGLSSQFAKRGYKTVDFRQVLSNSKTSSVMNADAQDDVMSMIVRQLPSDIVVIVDINIIPDGQKYNSCSLSVRAVESQTAAALASAAYAGNPYMTSDGVVLAKDALSKVQNSFFNDIKTAFDRMVQNGRQMKLEFNLGSEVSDWDFDEPTPMTDNDFREVLEDFLRDSSVGGVYDMGNSSSKFISADINIPIWDAEKGRGYTTSNFARDLRKMLKREIGDAYKPEVVEMGQKLVVTIK